jgi:D-glycero-alpha-D-manno-heptose-7-phosphate kinase
LDLPKALTAELEERLVLCYTGKPRLSSNIHENVWGAYKRGVPETINALYNLRNVAIRMKQVLLDGDLNEFGELLNQNWKHQKQLDPSVTNEQIDDLFQVALDSGATAGKACGAGGGGCVVFFCDREKRPDVIRAVEAAGTRFIDFKFDFTGLVVEEVK